MVPNPYLLLAAGVVVALAAWGGYSHGIETERGRAATEYAQAAHAAAEAARLDAEAESERRQAQALRNAGRAAASREAKLRGQLNALASAARPGCDWPDDRVRDINASVAAANAFAAPERVPDGLPDAPTADGARRDLGDGLDARTH